MPRHAVPAAIAVTLIAFVVYRTTMLPGVELGDSASFQVMVGSPTITPRDAYPLYFAIAGALHALLGTPPAETLNFVSVLEAAVACGLIVLVAATISGSAMAG